MLSRNDLVVFIQVNGPGKELKTEDDEDHLENYKQKSEACYVRKSVHNFTH